MIVKFSIFSRAFAFLSHQHEHALSPFIGIPSPMALNTLRDALSPISLPPEIIIYSIAVAIQVYYHRYNGGSYWSQTLLCWSF